MNNDINYVLHITKKCNWSCNYCIVDTHNADDISLDDVFYNISKIPDNSVVNLSGGEPGVLSTNTLVKIFDKLIAKGCEININTNGLFFKNHIVLDKYITNYFYHLSDNLDSIPFINNICNININKIDMMIVVDNNNFTNIDSFIDLFKSYNLNKKLIIYKSSRVGFDLSLKNIQYILKTFSNIIDREYISYLLIGSVEINKKDIKNNKKIFINR